MTSVRILWLILGLVWVGAEIYLARRKSAAEQSLLSSEAKSRGWLWLSLSLGVCGGLILKQWAWLPINLDYLPRQFLALWLWVLGVGLRGWAIWHLGVFFTTHVTIQQQHRLIDNGPYRFLRHPAYTGLWLALLAAGLAMGDWLALFCLTGISFWALMRRIAIEETYLAQAFKQDYVAYCQQRWRLLPGIY